MSNVISFTPEIVGCGITLDARQVLEGALEQDYQTVVIVGRDADGTIHTHSTHGLPETFVTMELARHSLMQDLL